jgi:hypothetical protein
MSLQLARGAEGAPVRGEHEHADAPVLLDAGEVLAQHRDVAALDAVVVARPVEPDGRAGAHDGEDGPGVSACPAGSSLGMADTLLEEVPGLQIGCAAGAGSPRRTLKRDDFSSNRHSALAS